MIGWSDTWRIVEWIDCSIQQVLEMGGSIEEWLDMFLNGWMDGWMHDG